MVVLMAMVFGLAYSLKVEAGANALLLAALMLACLWKTTWEAVATEGRCRGPFTTLYRATSVLDSQATGQLLFSKMPRVPMDDEPANEVGSRVDMLQHAIALSLRCFRLSPHPPCRLVHLGRLGRLLSKARL